VLAVLNGRIASLDDLTVAIASAEGAVAVLVDDFDQLLDAPWAAALEGLLRAGRHNQRAVIIAGGTAELNAASYKGLVAEAKKSRSGLMLSPGAPTDADLLGVRLPKTALFNGPAGRAVQIESGSHRLIQIADAGPGLAF
jgi:S-DNA-T family DNA segregation ATPase FtsK/SpoIIIE